MLEVDAGAGLVFVGFRAEILASTPTTQACNADTTKEAAGTSSGAPVNPAKR